ncbi:MAG: 16S rRNA processing protein RimM [Chloroflexi bacterium]|nr:16S rRNA processing protein RimM [Chloroflexota bacterium]
MGSGNRPARGRRSSGEAASSRRAESTDEPQFLAIGRIVAPRGVRGEMRVEIESDDPERFHALGTVYLGEEHRPFRVQGARLHQGRALLTLHGIADRSAAEAWRGVYVYVSREDALPLEENQYYHYQIIGLQAVTEEGEALGRISEVLTTGANDVYVIQGPRGEILLPAYQDVILHVDRASGRMVVRIPEGLV